MLWAMFGLTVYLKETPGPEESLEHSQLWELTRNVITGIGRPKKIQEQKEILFCAALVKAKLNEAGKFRHVLAQGPCGKTQMCHHEQWISMNLSVPFFHGKCLFIPFSRWFWLGQSLMVL